MATGIYPPVPGNVKREQVSPSHESGMRSLLHAFCGGLAALRAYLGKIFTRPQAKSRPVPVIHEEVRLTPEGVKVWEQVMDPASSVGKPTRHRRRRLANG